MGHTLSHLAARPRCYMVCLAFTLVAAACSLSASEIEVGVADATVVVTGSGVTQLPFVVTRSGDTVDGLRLIVETLRGGPNPGLPGEHYVPLAPGFEVLIEPLETHTTVNVDVIAEPESGPDKTLLLRITEAGAFNPQARLAATALHLSHCCDRLPRSMAVADLNSNGYPDIVTGNDLGLDISLFLSDGAGGYAEAVHLPLPEGVTSGNVMVALGDIDGDGHVDLVTAGFNAASVFVLFGDGAGNLSRPVEVPLGNNDTPFGLALTDVNGDGHLDILTSNGMDADVSVLINNGTGNFVAPQNFPVDNQFSGSMAVADVTGNGHPDVVTVHPQSNLVSVLEGNGDGTFAGSQSLTVGPSMANDRPQSVALGDVTGNGHIDIVTGNWGGPFFMQDAPGTVSVLESNGGGGFAAAQQLSLAEGPGRANSIVLADVIGNGSLDIIATRVIDNSVSILASDGSGGFSTAVRMATGAGPNPVAVADITGDGNLDVITANALSNNISVLPGDGAGKVGLPGNYHAGRQPHSVVVADLNGNGHLDAASANSIGGDVSVLLNDGAGNLVPAGSFEVGVSPTSIEAGDVNGDGIPDLVTANFGSGSVSVLLGDGAGGYSDAQTFSVGGAGYQSPYALALADVSGNGYLDIVTANPGPFQPGAETVVAGGIAGIGERDSVSVLIGDGQGGFLDATVYSVGPEGVGYATHSVALADVTGNGHIDILVTNLNTSNLSLLKGDGGGNFGETTHIDTGEGPVLVMVADVTGNGQDDIVTLNHTAQSVSLLAGQGAGNYADVTHFPIFIPGGEPCTSPEGYLACPWPWGMALADITGNGHIDIVTANTNWDTISVLMNDGSSQFSEIASFQGGAKPGALAVGDVSGNGYPDVVVANRENDTVSVHVNGLSSVLLLNDEALGTIVTELLDLIFHDRFELE